MQNRMHTSNSSTEIIVNILIWSVEGKQMLSEYGHFYKKFAKYITNVPYVCILPEIKMDARDLGTGSLSDCSCI